MHQYVAITEAFPLSINKEDLAWECLVKASRGSEEMTATLESLEGNSSLKSQLIDYVSFCWLANLYPHSKAQLGMGCRVPAERRACLQSTSGRTWCICPPRESERRGAVQGPQLAYTGHETYPPHY